MHGLAARLEPADRRAPLQPSSAGVSTFSSAAQSAGFLTPLMIRPSMRTFGPIVHSSKQPCSVSEQSATMTSTPGGARLCSSSSVFAEPRLVQCLLRHTSTVRGAPSARTTSARGGARADLLDGLSAASAAHHTVAAETSIFFAREDEREMLACVAVIAVARGGRVGPSAALRARSSAAAFVRVKMMSTTPAMDPARWIARFADGAADAQTVEVTAVPKAEWKAWLAAQPARTRGWLEALGRGKFKPGEWTAIPTDDTGTPALRQVVVGVENASSIWAYASLPGSLPAGRSYRLSVVGASAGAREATAAALSWALGSYEYDFLKTSVVPRRVQPARPTLLWPAECDRAAVARAATATYLCRDLITTPCEQLGPADLERAARDLAALHTGATVTAVTGDALLSANFPMIHAVGRAAGAGREPRLVELRWGRAGAPKVALVGKGVMFDTGGLDIKPSAAMLTMKKDMVRAACVCRPYGGSPRRVPSLPARVASRARHARAALTRRAALRTPRAPRAAAGRRGSCARPRVDGDELGPRHLAARASPHRREFHLWLRLPPR